MSSRIHGKGPRHCVLAAVAGAALLAACSQRQGATLSPDGSDPAALQSGADAQQLDPPQPDAARLAADVAWLAADERTGRRAGTPGADQAADWIAARLAELGLEPAGSDGYSQPFEVPLPPLDAGGSEVSWSRAIERGHERVVMNEGPARGEAHVVPLFCSAAGEQVGPLRFGGYGIVDEERERDDHAGGQLDGSVLLVARGAPPGPNGEPPESWGHAATLLGKVLTAKHRGAAAVLVAQHPDDPTAPPPFVRGGSAEAGIPCLSISADLAERLLPGYGARVRWLDGGEGSAPADGWASIDAPEPGLANAWVSARVERSRGTAVNVIGRVRGRGEAPTVVVGAHYDHIGLGDAGSLDPESIGEVHNGADDNASGTATALEIARILAQGPAPAGDVVIALWSGEELGLLGSRHFVQTPTFDLGNVAACVNLDMVGRAGDGRLTVLGAGSAAEFAGWMDAAGDAAGLALDVSLSGQAMGGSDHMSFLKAGIPSLALFSGVHGDYHRPSDDTELVEVEGLARVTALSLELVARTQATGDLAFVEPPPPGEGEEPTRRVFRASLGTIPEYGAEGVTGMLLAGTTPGSPAEAGGLQAGDVLRGVGDVEIESIYDLVHALQTYKAGDVVLVRYERDGAMHEVRVTLTTRAAR